MDDEGKEDGEASEEPLELDLSKKSLKKIDVAPEEYKHVLCLKLDENEIQKLENLETYLNLTELSLSNNHILRMYGISQLCNLVKLNLSSNSIVTIEGLKLLTSLKWLDLSKNKLKAMDHLTCNLELEYLDLSENSISLTANISNLNKLKTLHLHKNKITQLKQCKKHLPISLVKLTLHGNNIPDLNDVSLLVNLTELKELSINENPCVEFTCDKLSFDYRPYVKNWCMSLVTLDNVPLDDIECLKAEWLYSQGRGRSFRPGEHSALCEYLSAACPVSGERNIESEDERKLRLILSKAQHHQQQLKDQLTTPSPGSNLPTRQKTPLKKKLPGLAERMVSSFHDTSVKESSRSSPDLMSRSLDVGLLRHSPPLPSQSSTSLPDSQSPLQAASQLVPVPESLTSPDVCRPLHPMLSQHIHQHQGGVKSQLPHPLTVSTSRSSSHSTPHSTPESKRRTITGGASSCSPVSVKKYQHSPKLGSRSLTANSATSPKKYSPLSRGKSNHTSSVMTTSTAMKVMKVSSGDDDEEDEEDSEMTLSKLHGIKQRATQKRHKKQTVNKKKTTAGAAGGGEDKENINKVNSGELWRAAVCIQRRWRGYKTRNLNQDVVCTFRNIQTNRIQDYIIKVVSDMEETRAALEGNRKLQELQMQAINALWKKMTSQQQQQQQQQEQDGCDGDSRNTLQDLAQTCLSLHKQVEELQHMMKILHQNNSPAVPTATQTEIVAVHTPQGDGKEIFPYKGKTDRPNNLAITQSAPEQVQQFVTTLVSDVIKSVSTSSGPDSGSEVNDMLPMEIDSTTAIPDAVDETQEENVNEEVTNDAEEPDNVSSSGGQDKEYQNGCPSS